MKTKYIYGIVLLFILMKVFTYHQYQRAQESKIVLERWGAFEEEKIERELGQLKGVFDYRQMKGDLKPDALNNKLINELYKDSVDWQSVYAQLSAFEELSIPSNILTLMQDNSPGFIDEYIKWFVLKSIHDYEVTIEEAKKIGNTQILLGKENNDIREVKVMDVFYEYGSNPQIYINDTLVEIDTLPYMHTGKIETARLEVTNSITKEEKIYEYPE